MIPTPFSELTREEWFDVMREVKPDIDHDEFDEAWDEFISLKRFRERTDA